MTIKKIAAINDITGVGRCGLSVIIPTLSTMGFQICPFPTAVLSTHPGFGTDYCLHSLADISPQYLEHWQQINAEFDCYFSGYIPSASQMELFRRYFTEIKKERPQTLIVIDPVMGDNGTLYRIYRGDMVKKMRAFANTADVITPNYTEACMLLEREYITVPLTTAEIEALLKSLYKEYGMAVIKGIACGDSMVNGSISDDAKISLHHYQQLPQGFPGTGDIFAAILTGRLLNGDDIHQATAFAGRATTKLTQITLEAGTEPRQGILLEQNLSILRAD